MESVLNNPLFNELTEDEKATLNGGRYCYYAWAYRCYIQWYRRICQYIYVIRCY